MYLTWSEKIISDFSESNIESLYNHGYVFTRIDKGVMTQTRSIRVDLKKFVLSSENKRVLKKVEDIDLFVYTVPYSDYNWTIGKMAKDFYDKKFGDKTFSANKTKELLTDNQKSNFNCLLRYTYKINSSNPLDFEIARQLFQTSGKIDPLLSPPPTGVCIAYVTKNILHYSYPFYDLNNAPKDMGLGMMTKAILWAKESGREYMYLGSAQRPTDTYKFQFDGIEWFDGQNWKNDLVEIKNILQIIPKT